MFYTLHIFFLILVINKRSTGGKNGSTNEYECVHTADFAPSQNTTMGGLRSKELRQWSTSITLPGPETTLEAPHSQDATG